jgi:4-hydroxybenzoate polyprenyltransferase
MQDVTAILIRALRAHQWVKNLLVFVPLILGGKASDFQAWTLTAYGFIALCCVASAGYLINDLRDLPHDRNHWSKRDRPLASGALSRRSAMLLIAAGIAVGGSLATYLGLAAVLALALYLALTTSYSLYLKRIPLLDVFVLACLFTFRLGFGVVLANVRPSSWLLIFSMFVFLSLSLAKRHTELYRVEAGNAFDDHGRGYRPQDLPLILGMGLAAALGAVLIAVLYLVEDAFPSNFYSSPSFLWVTPSLIFLFLARVWLLSQRGLLHDDPIAFAIRDGVSLLIGLLTSIAFVAAVYWSG